LSDSWLQLNFLSLAGRRPTDDTQRAACGPLFLQAIVTMRFQTILLVGLLSLGLCGCSHRDWFAPLDRCYLADWTNHHSYLSCCRDGDGSGHCNNCDGNYTTHDVAGRAVAEMSPR